MHAVRGADGNESESDFGRMWDQAIEGLTAFFSMSEFLGEIIFILIISINVKLDLIFVFASNYCIVYVLLYLKHRSSLC